MFWVKKWSTYDSFLELFYSIGVLTREKVHTFLKLNCLSSHDFFILDLKLYNDWYIFLYIVFLSIISSKIFHSWLRILEPNLSCFGITQLFLKISLPKIKNILLPYPIFDFAFIEDFLNLCLYKINRNLINTVSLLKISKIIGTQISLILAWYFHLKAQRNQHSTNFLLIKFQRW